MVAISNLTVSYERPIDGYWQRMGVAAVDALRDTLHPDLTPRRRKLIAEYLAGLFDGTYKMGIRLGELQANLNRDDDQQGT